MESIIKFSTSVKNLVAKMETLNSVGHMTNQQLLEHFIHKLAISMKMQWGMIAATVGREQHNLKDFSSWLEDIVFAASFAITSPPQSGH